MAETTTTYRRRAAFALGVLALAIGTGSACSSSNDSGSAPGSDRGPDTALVASPSTSALPPLSTPAQINDATAHALDHAPQLTLDPEQRSCVATRLQADPILVNSLGDNPATSRRWDEVLRIASDCINSVTFSAEFTTNLQQQAGGTLSAEQMDCVRHTSASWSSDTVQRLIRSGLNPGTTEPTAQTAVNDLLTKCSIDPSKLSQPQTP